MGLEFYRILKLPELKIGDIKNVPMETVPKDMIDCEEINCEWTKLGMTDSWLFLRQKIKKYENKNYKRL